MNKAGSEGYVAEEVGRLGYSIQKLIDMKDFNGKCRREGGSISRKKIWDAQY